MSGYAHVTLESRYQFFAPKQAGCSMARIGEKTGYCKSTVSREFKRNSCEGGYDPERAQALAESRWSKHSVERWTDADWAAVDEKLAVDWSPEQASERLRLERAEGAPSFRAIYNRIARDKLEGGALWECLRRRQKPYKQRGKPETRGQIKGRRSIDERPPEVAARLSVGDWEGDLVAGSRGYWVSLTERHSRYTLVGAVKKKTAAAVAAAVVRLFAAHKDRVRSITLDNGREFAFHQRIERLLDAPVYFAHPYSSWERGTNERMNGDLRQYSPKRAPIAWNSRKLINLAQERLNNRPRKCLGWRTPHEVYYRLL